VTDFQFSIKDCIPIPDSKFEPYLSAGTGDHWLGENSNTSNSHYHGRGAQVGFGTEYHFGDHVSFTCGLSGKRIFFDSGSWIGAADVKVNAATIDLGLTHHFK
jgi:hypothetical protein